jgi:hypothetical protein
MGFIWDELQKELVNDGTCQAKFLPEWNGVRPIPKTRRRFGDADGPKGGTRRAISKVCEFEEKYFRDRVSVKKLIKR